MTANELWYKALNEAPGLVGPPIGKPPESLLQYFREWLAGDGYPFWPFWENVRSWWEIRELPNLMLLHFADLKADLPGQMRRANHTAARCADSVGGWWSCAWGL